MHLKKKHITIGIIAGAAILFMALAVWIGMMLGARSRENQTDNKAQSSAPGTVESIAESAVLGDSIPADSGIGGGTFPGACGCSGAAGGSCDRYPGFCHH